MTQSKYQDEPKYWGLSDEAYAEVVAAREAEMVRFVPSTFGEYLDYPYPEGVSGVIICVKVDIGSMRPVSVCLTHQVYRKKLEELIERYPTLTEFVIVPIRNREYVSVPRTLVKPFLATAIEKVRPTLAEQVRAAMERHRKNEAAGKYLGKGEPRVGSDNDARGN